jgi:hypothetical protein
VFDFKTDKNRQSQLDDFRHLGDIFKTVKVYRVVIGKNATEM